MGGGLKVSFGAFLKNRFVDFCNFTTLIRILAPSFRTLPSKLSMPAALDGLFIFDLMHSSITVQF